MKILFIAPKYSGGIGGHAYRVAEKLREHGFDIKLMHVPHIPKNKLKNHPQCSSTGRTFKLCVTWFS